MPAASAVAGPTELEKKKITAAEDLEASAGPPTQVRNPAGSTPSGSGGGVFPSSRAERMSEPVRSPAAAPPPSIEAEPGPDGDGRARGISLKIPVAGRSDVSVQLMERSGALQVAVRTPDSTLAASLRHGIGDLIQKLEAQGFRAETFLPGGSVQPARSPAGSSHAGEEQRGEHSSGGFGGDGGREQQRRRQQGEDQPPWLDEMNKTMRESTKRGTK